jgi:starvation-inducible DNA-binding protein
MLQMLQTSVDPLNFNLLEVNQKKSLNRLFFDMKDFSEQVKICYNDYQGPDYFDLHESFKELFVFLDQVITRIGRQLKDFTTDILNDFLPNNTVLAIQKSKRSYSDADRISNVVTGLGDLIQSGMITVLENAKDQELLTQCFGNDFFLELENKRWLFSMYYKY